MRISILVIVCLLAGCSTEAVRCDRHLTAINPQKMLGGSTGERREGSEPVPPPNQGEALPKRSAAADAASQKFGARDLPPKSRKVPAAGAAGAAGGAPGGST